MAYWVRAATGARGRLTGSRIRARSRPTGRAGPAPRRWRVARAAGGHGDQAAGDVQQVAHHVLRAEAVEIGRALDPGVQEVHHEHQRQQAEEPLPPLVVVVAVVGVVVQALREDQRAQQVQQQCEQGHEEVQVEVPLHQVRKPVLPPPKPDQVRKHEERPQQVHAVDLVAAGPLDDAGEVAQQVGQPQAHDHAHQHPHMQVDRGHGGGVGRVGRWRHRATPVKGMGND